MSYGPQHMQKLCRKAPPKRISLLTAAVRLACKVAERHDTPWQAVIRLRHSAFGEGMGRGVCRRRRFDRRRGMARLRVLTFEVGLDLLY
jgi:hypothetical protein